MIRIYTKPKGQIPDYNEPVILHDTNPSLEMFCNRIHKVGVRGVSPLRPVDVPSLAVSISRVHTEIDLHNIEPSC